MHDMVRDYWARFNLPLEGEVNYMYLDSRGWVSTGVGNKIDETPKPMTPATPQQRSASLAVAGKIHWQLSGAPATADQVAVDWDSVKGRLDLASFGHLQFEALTKVRITAEEIQRIVATKLLEMEGVLTTRPEFVDFATWPASAQLATLSMCWGLGPAFRFPDFQACVVSHNWAGAAAECHFTPDEGTIKIRNRLNRMHLLNAQAATDRGLAVGALAASTNDVLSVQHDLWMLGYNPGMQDGGEGPRTQQALTDFQGVRGLAETGNWNEPTTQAELATALTELGWVMV